MFGRDNKNKNLQGFDMFYLELLTKSKSKILHKSQFHLVCYHQGPNQSRKTRVQLTKYHFHQFQTDLFLCKDWQFALQIFFPALKSWSLTVNERIFCDPPVARLIANTFKSNLIISGLIYLHASRIPFTTVRRGGVSS